MNRKWTNERGNGSAHAEMDRKRTGNESENEPAINRKWTGNESGNERGN